MRMYIIFLLALALLCGVKSDTLESVFGTPPSQNAAQAVQVAAVTPVNYFNTSAADNDEMDTFDDYIPTRGDYDKFDLTLTKYVASKSEQNFLISPLGVKIAMALLNEASSSATQAELDLVLDFEPEKSLVRTKMSRILNSLESSPTKYTVSLGSRIYVRDGVQILQKFASIAKDFYKTDTLNVNFDEPRITANAINDWVSNTTRGKISHLVEEGDVHGAVILMINTLFFKGTWRYQFDPKLTRNQAFYTSAKVTKETAFMRGKNKFYYTDSARFDAKILRMPYLGNKFAMYIVVPNTLFGVGDIFNDVIGLRSELMKLKQYLVDVTLPRFDFQYTTHLNDILRDMGVRLVFEDNASLAGLSRGRYLPQKLKVSNAVQKSGIEVNEIGTVAFAATELSIVNKFGEDTPNKAEVIANRPFMFFIQDEVTKQMLFMGRYSDPNLSLGILKPKPEKE